MLRIHSLHLAEKIKEEFLLPFQNDALPGHVLVHSYSVCIRQYCWSLRASAAECCREKNIRVNLGSLFKALG